MCKKKFAKVQLNSILFYKTYVSCKKTKDILKEMWNSYGLNDSTKIHILTGFGREESRC